MRTGSDKSCGGNQNTHFTFNCFLVFENRAVVVTWKNNAESGKPQTTNWRMRTACWIPKSQNTHKVYVFLVVLQCNNGRTNALPWYVIRTLPAFEFPDSTLKPRLLLNTGLTYPASLKRAALEATVAKQESRAARADNSYHFIPRRVNVSGTDRTFGTDNKVVELITGTDTYKTPLFSRLMASEQETTTTPPVTTVMTSRDPP